jgi:hypothetical protein
MALLTATTPVIAGTLAAPAAMSTADTISGNLVGGYLKVVNGSGGSVNFTIADPGRTAAGNTGTQAASAIAAGAARWYPLEAAFVNSATNLINVTLSAATSVTYELLPPTP